MRTTNRPYYTEYVNHILRFYARHPSMVHFKTDADRLNHRAAQTVFYKLPQQKTAVLFDIYTRNDTLGDNVYEVARSRKMGQDDIYTLITRVSNLIAKERGLI